MSKLRGFYASRLFQPTSVVPKGSEIKNRHMPKSQKLMLDLGLMRPSGSPGVFHYLPLGLRVLEKLTALVDRHMRNLGAQKLQLACLTDATIWKKSERWELEQMDSFKLQDRHSKEYLLSPTGEEAVAAMVGGLPALSHKSLPLLLYQITSKFRDEVRPRAGLLRSREFLMQDLYSFHPDFAQATSTYKAVLDTYSALLQELAIPFTIVKAATGAMGGSESHELQVELGVGEDVLLRCLACSHTTNAELSNYDVCPKCSSSDLSRIKSIEVGHTFLLGTKYSEALGAQYVNREGTKRPLVMGSYGLGLSRLLAASVELLSLEDQLRWPPSLSPFSLTFIPPKEGSKEAEECGVEMAHHLHDTISSLVPDTLFDDRPGLSVGRKLRDSQRLGVPTAVLMGKHAPSLLELHSLSSPPRLLSLPELLQHFNEQSCSSQLESLSV